MSFTQNYGVRDPSIDDSEETIFTNDELLQEQIDNFLAEEEALIQRIKAIDKERNLWANQ